MSRERGGHGGSKIEKRINQTLKKQLRRSFTCECGKVNEFSPWVFAHWDMILIHKCDCGRRHEIFQGKAEEI